MPEADSTANAPEILIGDASKSRYFAYLLDTILAIVFTIAIATNLDVLDSLDPLVRGLLGFALFFIYYFLFEGIFGRTPGKMYLGLVVCAVDGSRCSWTQAGVRSFLRILETNPFFLGGFPAVLFIWFTKKKQRFADLVAGTIVMSNRQLLDDLAERDDNLESCHECGEVLQLGQNPCPVCGTEVGFAIHELSTSTNNTTD